MKKHGKTIQVRLSGAVPAIELDLATFVRVADPMTIRVAKVELLNDRGEVIMTTLPGDDSEDDS